MRLLGLSLLALLITGPLGLFTHIYQLNVVGVIALLFGVLRYSMIGKRRIRVGIMLNKVDYFWLLMVVVAYSLSIVRGLGNDSIQGIINGCLKISLVGLVIYFAAQETLKGHSFEERVKIIMFDLFWPLAVMVVVNVVGYLFGLEAEDPGGDADSTEETPSVIANLLGLSVGRTSFFLAGHPNGFGIFVGWVLVMGILMWRYGRYNGIQKLLIVGTVAAGFFALLILDSRGTIGATIFSLMLIMFLFSFRMIKWIRVIVLVLPVLSFSSTFILQEIGESDMASSISREKGEMSTGNGRIFFWKYCIEAMAEPEIDHFFGYGQNGHITSGVADRYKWVLNRYTYTHNYLFQTFFDMGYFGLFSMLILMLSCAKAGIRLVEQGPSALPVIFAIFPVYYLFSGFFEATFGQFNHLYTYCFFIITAGGIALYNLFLIHQSSGLPMHLHEDNHLPVLQK